MPVTNAPAITVPAIIWYGEAGICRLPELRVSVEPPFRKASFWSCRFCTAVGSGWAASGWPAANGRKARQRSMPGQPRLRSRWRCGVPGVPEWKKNTEEAAACRYFPLRRAILRVVARWRIRGCHRLLRYSRWRAEIARQRHLAPAPSAAWVIRRQAIQPLGLRDAIHVVKARSARARRAPMWLQ